eukprot:NODE_4145_length_359_cov_310.767742_g3561_i0.p2 GENE.NODE_4145_length_359_cov_310.767742_g3561_i0~~NODE_4145_length_359_cov_310.767742_g3561_i0.p2  ORF type:complete len:57 (-),score=7.79 NODE_4145_length_359_cov_310.767742_g3561_i0:73-243(-)
MPAWVAGMSFHGAEEDDDRFAWNLHELEGKFSLDHTLGNGVLNRPEGMNYLINGHR